MPEEITLYSYIQSELSPDRGGDQDDLPQYLKKIFYNEDSHYTPLRLLLSTIYYLPCDVRKFLLDLARI
jgi:hypothetical protein